MKRRLTLMLAFLAIGLSNLYSTDTLQIDQATLESEYRLATEKYFDSLEQTLVYERGEVSLNGGVVIINVPSGYKYLNGKDSEMILTEIWGNPPSEEGDKSLGMLVPEDESIFIDSTYSINITYSEEGYINDEDAKDIDYDDLLASMQADSEMINEYRVENGYAPVYLIGWGSPPYYDAINKKLHWAKELRFGDDPDNTLNYNIRILGRRGYLQLNVIGYMDVLPEVRDNIDPILNSVSFTEGNKYADFNPKFDKVAAYGIGGLIAGKVLAKAGILAKIGVLLAKFWKFIAIAFVGIVAGVRRFFGKKEEPLAETDTDIEGGEEEDLEA